MNDSLIANDVITVVSLIVPAVFAMGVWLWFRSTLSNGKLLTLFLESFTVCAALIVLVGALIPKYFDIAGDNKAFLIIVSLSAVLHATSSVGNAISEAKWRAQAKTHSKPMDRA